MVCLPYGPIKDIRSALVQSTDVTTFGFHVSQLALEAWPLWPGCLLMNAFSASVNLDAFIAIRSSHSREETSRKL